MIFFVLFKHRTWFLFFLLFLLCVFTSPGGHYRRQLWARRTHQEPQRDRYRWVLHLFFGQPACFPESPSGYISNPPRFDPPRWPIAIIPPRWDYESVATRMKVCLQRDNPAAIRPGEMINASARPQGSAWMDLIKSETDLTVLTFMIDFFFFSYSITLSFMHLAREKQHLHSFGVSD